MRMVYGLGTGLYHAAIRLASPWNSKAAAWLSGRRGLWERLEARTAELQGCLWMHCASVGEFEQGRPVLEAIKQQRPELPVLLTFFSPSGHEVHKDHPLATHVEYLPADTVANASRLLSLVRPSAAIFVKYEFWYHHLQALHASAVPTFLISAVFRKDQPFFRWYGGAWRRMLACFTHVFTQDEASRALLETIGAGPVSVGGDTRFDRVVEIATSGAELPLVHAFKGDAPLLVCGSTWPPDERLLSEALKDLGKAAPKCVVVPHELHPARLDLTDRLFPKPLARWTELEHGDPVNIAATLGRERNGSLVVDRMGLLARSYRYADIAYVGGGFTDGIHSILEAAAWGVPVIFGPKHGKFPEAQGLIDAGAARMITDASGLKATIAEWSGDPALRQRSAEAARRFVMERRGAAGTVALAVLKALDRQNPT